MTHYLYICITCKDLKNNANNNGEDLLTCIQDNKNPIFNKYEIRPVKCFNACKNACVIGLFASEKAGYIIGDQFPENINDVEKMLTVYYSSIDGIVKKMERPDSMQKTVIARIPAIK